MNRHRTLCHSFSLGYAPGPRGWVWWFLKFSNYVIYSILYYYLDSWLTLASLFLVAKLLCSVGRKDIKRNETTITSVSRMSFITSIRPVITSIIPSTISLIPILHRVRNHIRLLPLSFSSISTSSTSIFPHNFRSFSIRY